MEEKLLYYEFVNNYKCKYYLTKSTRSFVDNNGKLTSFGVRIDTLNNEGRLLARSALNDVGINREDVKKYILSLKEGHFTAKELSKLAL